MAIQMLSEGKHYMREMALSNGHSVIVDESDYEWLVQWSWYGKKNGYGVYATRHVRTLEGKDSYVWMHRAILEAPKGIVVDHIDGNSLNNSRSNLRLCTRQQNEWNSARQHNNTSGYIGVFWHANGNNWQARIRNNGKFTTIGTFQSREDAAAAYDKVAFELRGEFARLNNVA